MSKEAIKLALDALQLIKEADSHYATPKQVCHARALYEPTIKTLEEALAKQEQGEPVAWRYKPVREDNPRWEYTTQHPLDMGDGYLRPSLVEYCKCIEPLYATEKPKLMLEKFREMKDLLDEPKQEQSVSVGEPLGVEPVAWMDDEGIRVVTSKQKLGMPERLQKSFPNPLSYTTPQPAERKRKPLTDEQKLDLVTNWFAELWAIEKAMGLLDDYEAAHGIKENK